MEPFITQRLLQSLGRFCFPSLSLFYIPLETEATGRARPTRSLLSVGTSPAYAAAVFPFSSCFFPTHFQHSIFCFLCPRHFANIIQRCSKDLLPGTRRTGQSLSLGYHR